MRAGRMHLPALINLSAFCTAVDVVGTTALLLVSIVLMLWLSGKIFRLGVLRTGQPQRVRELWRLLTATA